MSHFQSIHAWLHANASDQRPPEGYTGSPRPHLGVRNPAIRTFVNEWHKINQTIAFEDWLALLDALYHGETYEERIIPGFLLAKHHGYRRRLDLTMLNCWLGQLEGWAEVDNTCQSAFQAKDLLARWDEWESFLRQLAHDDNINKRRASLVLLKTALSQSADMRLYTLAMAQVEQLKHEKDKRITKAISWILREASKHHPELIETYLNQHASSLPAIAVRETRTKLATGKK